MAAGFARRKKREETEAAIVSIPRYNQGPRPVKPVSSREYFFLEDDASPSPQLLTRQKAILQMELLNEDAIYFCESFSSISSPFFIIRDGGTNRFDLFSSRWRKKKREILLFELVPRGRIYGWRWRFDRVKRNHGLRLLKGKRDRERKFGSKKSAQFLPLNIDYFLWYKIIGKKLHDFYDNYCRPSELLKIYVASKHSWFLDHQLALLYSWKKEKKKEV